MKRKEEKIKVIVDYTLTIENVVERGVIGWRDKSLRNSDFSSKQVGESELDFTLFACEEEESRD